MRKTKVDASAMLLALIALLAAGGIVFTVFSLRHDSSMEAFSDDRVINTLFVIENAGKPLCSYVLMYYPQTKRAAVFDIPGSLGLFIQSIDLVDRIDTVYNPRGITPFANEIEKLLEIDISFTMVLTLDNLGRVTDLIEGVEIFIPSLVNEYQNGYIMFPSGITFLDGDKARTYITYELPEEAGELAVLRRQRFFTGFIKRLGEQNLYLRNQQAGQTLYDFFTTPMSRSAFDRLFAEFAGIDTARVTVQSVGGNTREISGKPLTIPFLDGTLIKDIVRQTSGGLIQPSGSASGDRVFTVEVLNGTAVNGLAGRTAELLRGFGYDIILVGNADSGDYDETLIIDRSGFENVAREFAGVIRCENIRFDSPSQANSEIDISIQNYEYKPDFTVIIGKDFDGRYITK